MFLITFACRILHRCSDKESSEETVQSKWPISLSSLRSALYQFDVLCTLFIWGHVTWQRVSYLFSLYHPFLITFAYRNLHSCSAKESSEETVKSEWPILLSSLRSAPYQFDVPCTLSIWGQVTWLRVSYLFSLFRMFLITFACRILHRCSANESSEETVKSKWPILLSSLRSALY